MSYIDTENNFFGRTETLDLLKKRVVDLKEGYRQNVALLGNQYLGKSAILNQFVRNLDDSEVTVIYLELENKDFYYLSNKFCGSLLYNFSKNNNLPLFDQLDLLVESTKDVLPQTTQVIARIQSDVQSGKFAQAYLGLLTLPEVFTTESGQFCILILDEFQNIEDLDLTDAFINLGKKIMTQKKCLYIVSCSYPDLAKKILTEKLSLLFGNFEVIPVQSFDLHNSQCFIESHVKDKRIGAQLRNFLTDFTGGHPLYLNLICQELINISSVHKQNEIYMPIVSQAIENTIFDRWGVLSRHFELIIHHLCAGKGNGILSGLLMAVSNDKNKIEDLVDAVAVKRNQVKVKLTRLVEMGIVVKNGNFYYFKDKLFKYWIKFVYQKRIKDVELALDKQRRHFKDELNVCIENFNATSRKDFSSRIVDLLHCFDNEAFQLNGRRYKLPTFCEITPVTIRNSQGQRIEILKASTNQSTWVIALKVDNFIERDLNILMNEIKQFSKKPERCVLLSLKGLDDHMRVKALQERFWIWNEEELNTLLTVFGKPFILR